MNRLYINKDWSTLKKLLVLNAANGGATPKTETLSGNLVTFSTTKAVPLIDCKVEINPVQAGSGDPSPENIRPISGWTGVKVWRSGVNMFVLPDGTQSVAGVDYTYDSVTNTMTKSGTSADVAGLNFGSIYLPAGTYTFSADFSGETGKSTRIHLRDSATNTNVGNISKSSPSLTISLDGTYYIRVATNAGETGGTISKFQLEQSQTQTDYVTNHCEAYSVTFPSDPGTVYGGTLDVVSGALTVDRAMVDLGDLSYVKDLNYYNRFYAPLSGAKTTATTVAFNGISSMYKAIPFNDLSLVEDGVMTLSTGGNISIRNLGLISGTAADFKTAMTGQTLVYELATPLTYHLTPTEIKTLVGINNVWSDAGDVDVTYYK